MGNTFEIWTWLDRFGHSYHQIWVGEDKEAAFKEFERLKATGDHPCLKLEWR